MRCEGCGAQINPESKICEYCKVVVNPDGQDLTTELVECFVVEDVFILVNRAVIVGKVLHSLKVGDIVSLREKNFEIVSMQVSRNIVDSASAGDSCGLVFKNFSKKDLSRGDRLYCKK